MSAQVEGDEARKKYQRERTIDLLPQHPAHGSSVPRHWICQEQRINGEARSCHQCGLQGAHKKAAGHRIENLLGEEEWDRERVGCGDEQRVKWSLGQGELIVGAQPLAGDQVAGQLNEQTVIVPGVADGVDILTAGKP